jgi:hypothetical protein
MILPDFFTPRGELAAQLIKHRQAGLQLHAVALAVIKSNSFHTLVLCQGVC